VTRKRRCSECSGSFTGEHHEVGLTSEYGVHAHVDSGLAPLVAACWDLGIATTHSCQGSPDEHAYIALSPGVAEAFARAVTFVGPEEFETLPDDSLDVRIYQLHDAETPGWWWHPGYPWGVSGFVVYFPASDIPELTRRLQERVAALGGPW
jgi:hypothetical protein